MSEFQKSRETAGFIETLENWGCIGEAELQGWKGTRRGSHGAQGPAHGAVAPSPGDAGAG
jgi:hypothetical protein